jgi:hypothetical protein
VVPHHGTDQAAHWLTAQIGRDAVLSVSYGRRYNRWLSGDYKSKSSLTTSQVLLQPYLLRLQLHLLQLQVLLLTSITSQVLL